MAILDKEGPTVKLLPILIFLVLAVLVALVFFAKGRTAKGSYVAKQVQTQNEIEFFHRLVKAFPEHYVFPQVAMSALIAPKRGGDRDKTSFWKIAQKRVDYAICTQAMRTVAIVELDDRTHNARNDELRDAMPRSAGIVTFRFESKNRPSIARLREVMSTVVGNL